MGKINFFIVLTLLMVYGHNTYAQIGYQINLLNTATGEPRANETVNVTVTLTNNEGKVIYTGNQSATTNDFGVLSLTIGDADTFKEVDFTKMPFYIEVIANGVAIGKSQVLNVPVAEYAKRTGTLTKEFLVGTWKYDVTTWENNNSYYTKSNSNGDLEYVNYSYISYHRFVHKIQFFEDGTYTYYENDHYRWTKGYINGGVPKEQESHDDPEVYSGEYYINGNEVWLLGCLASRSSDGISQSHTINPNYLLAQFLPEKNILGLRDHSIILIKQ